MSDWAQMLTVAGGIAAGAFGIGVHAGQRDDIAKQVQENTVAIDSLRSGAGDVTRSLNVIRTDIAFLKCVAYAQIRGDDGTECLR